MELARFPSHGGFSVRSIFKFGLAVVITVLLAAIFISQPTNAADATWNGASLEYDGKSFYLAGTAEENQFPGIPADSRYYVSVDQSSTNASTGLQKAYVIYLAPGVDPPGDGTATYALFDYTPSTEELSNPTNTQAIAVDVDTINAQVTTCAIEGVGWIVCPVMNFLAWGMDFVFDLIAEFMEVQPLQVNNTEGSLYNAWNIMRGVANIAFVIAFLIIIYAQLTSVQLNNYGLKRLLPRLIIAAIAINVSYIIAAVAVDLSNILGWSIHDIFTNLRNDVWSTGVAEAGNQAAMLSWESITGFVLSGGTATLAAGIGVAGAISATGGAATAAVFILLPALVGLLLTILVVLLVLAARQALVVILVIIAPLAIVAYLLPNTEKWFGKWRELFMTMLIFFPAFSVVFGGSQLAGGIIIQNASSINMLILGLIVQVAPLVITPLLLRFSGSVLGGVMKLINDPNKGILDHTRNWSKSHADWHAARGRGGLDRKGNPMDLKKRNFMRQSARYLDQRKRRRSDRTANAETATQTAYENSGVYTKMGRNGKVKYDMAIQKATIEAKKEATHSHHAAHVDAARRNQGSMLYSAAMDAQVQKERAEQSQNATSAYYNAIRSDSAHASRVGASALHTSSYNLEASKSRLESTESLKNAYYQQQSATPGTTLNIAAERAASSKEHLEVAQNQLQAFFDTQRRTAGTGLNASTIKLEESKSAVETAKSNLTTYINKERATVGTDLHVETIRSEKAKLASQVAETQLSKVVDEYKSGKIVRTGELHTLMTSMVDDIENLSAETQAVQNAQNQQKKNIAEAFTAGTTRAQELITTAQSVDPNGGVRAEARALADLIKINQEARSTNEQLIEVRASKSGVTPKQYVAQLLQNRLDDDMSESDDLIAAALEMAGKEPLIPLIREVRRSSNFDQDTVSDMLLRNSSTMKAKGGFDLQANLNLAGASAEVMDASIAGMLGSVAAENYIGLKNGALVDYRNRFTDILAATDQLAASGNPEERKYGENGLAGLKSTYFNLTEALRDKEIITKLGDNLAPAIDMYKELHARYGDPSKNIDNIDELDPRI